MTTHPDGSKGEGKRWVGARVWGCGFASFLAPWAGRAWLGHLPPLGGAEGSTMVKDLMSQQATLGAALLCVFMRLM